MNAKSQLNKDGEITLTASINLHPNDILQQEGLSSAGDLKTIFAQNLDKLKFTVHVAFYEEHKY